MSTEAENTPAHKETDPGRLGLRGRLGFLLKDSILYGGAAAFMQGLSLITFPIMSRHFDVADYGTIDFFGVVGTFLAVLLAFGINRTVARFFYDSTETKHRKQVISQGLAMNLLIAIPAVCAMYLASDVMIGFAPKSPDTQLLITLTILDAPLAVVTTQALAICKWSYARKRYLVLAVGTAVLRATVLVTLILVFDVGVVGIFWMNIALSGVSALVGIAFIAQWLEVPRFNAMAGAMIIYALPLWLISTLSVVGPLIERGITNRIFGDEGLGLYAAGAKIAMLISLPLFAFQMAWGPLALSIHKEENSHVTYSLILRLYTLCAWTAALMLGALAPFLLWLLAPPEYAKGYLVTLPLAVGLAFTGLQGIIDLGITIKKKSHLRIPGFLAGITVGLPAIYVLGSHMGIVGIALGSLLMKTVEMIINAAISIRIHPMQWPVERVTTTCVIGIIFGLAITAGQLYGTIAWSYVISAVTICTFVILAYRITMKKDEQQALVSAIVEKFRSITRP